MTIASVSFDLLYHFVLTYANRESLTLCHGETFLALSEGLQETLWRLDGPT